MRHLHLHARNLKRDATELQLRSIQRKDLLARPCRGVRHQRPVLVPRALDLQVRPGGGAAFVALLNRHLSVWQSGMINHDEQEEGAAVDVQEVDGNVEREEQQEQKEKVEQTWMQTPKPSKKFLSLPSSAMAPSKLATWSVHFGNLKPEVGTPELLRRSWNT